MKWIFISLISALAILMVSCDSVETETTTAESKNIDSLLVAQPDNIDLLIKRGEQRFKNYEYDLALVDAAKAFRLDTNNLAGQMLYAEVINNRSNRTPQEVGTAQRIYAKIIRKAPRNVRGLVGLASTFSYMHQWEQSFKFINDALKVDKHYREAYVLKGSNYYQMGDMDKAKSSYETAVQQDPKFFEAYFKLGLIYQDENDIRCIEYFKTVCNLKPEILEFKYQLAYAKQAFGEIEEAKILYREMAHDTVEFYLVRGLFHQGWIKHFVDEDIDSAMYFYQSALKTEPRYVEAWHNLGMCHDAIGNKTGALESFAKALKYNPGFELSRAYADSIQYL